MALRKVGGLYRDPYDGTRARRLNTTAAPGVLISRNKNSAAKVACIVACTLATAGCGRGRGGTQRAGRDAARRTASSSASPPSLGAADVPDGGAVPRPPLVPAGGRIFFGTSTSQTDAMATDELLVLPTANGVNLISGYVNLFSGYEDLTGTLDALGHIQIARVGGESLSLTLYADGSFDGVCIWADGSKGAWIRTPFRPLSSEQLAVRAGFQGFVSENVRYRVKVSMRGDEVEGVARYAATRQELRLRGNLHRDTRTLAVDELDSESHVVGHIEALVLGHPSAVSFSAAMRLVGTWTSPDGRRKLPFRLDEGYYPDRVTVSTGQSLVAQEHYAAHCDKIEERVWPVVEGAPSNVMTATNAALKSLTMHGPSIDPEPPELVALLKPGTYIDRTHCNDKTAEDRGSERGVFVPTPLHGSWVAIRFEHSLQQGSISGHAWTDCVALDLATGEIIAPGTLLDDTTRATLTSRARKAALAGFPDVGRADTSSDPTRRAAAQLSLEKVPLCIEEKQVRFALMGHRMYGPGQPTFTRDEVWHLLPAGKLRDLVETRVR